MKCKKCGAELKGSWMFCPDCGERLEDEFSIFDTPSIDDIMAENKQDTASVISESASERNLDELTKKKETNEKPQEEKTVDNDISMDPIPESVLESFMNEDTEEPKKTAPEPPKAEPRKSSLKPETPSRPAGAYWDGTKKRVILPEAKREKAASSKNYSAGIIFFILEIIFMLIAIISVIASKGTTHLTFALIVGSICAVIAVLLLIVGISFARPSGIPYKSNIVMIILSVGIMIFSDVFATNYTIKSDENEWGVPYSYAGSITNFYPEAELYYFISETPYISYYTLNTEDDFDYLVALTDDDASRQYYEDALEKINDYGLTNTVKYFIFDKNGCRQITIHGDNGDFGFSLDKSYIFHNYSNHIECQALNAFASSLSAGKTTPTVTTTYSTETGEVSGVFASMDRYDSGYALMDGYYYTYVKNITAKNMYTDGYALATSSDFDYLIALDLDDMKDDKYEESLKYLNDLATSGKTVKYFIFETSKNSTLMISYNDSLRVFGIDNSYIIKNVSGHLESQTLYSFESSVING